MRAAAETIEYQSLEDMEPFILEYIRAKPVWQQFLERGIDYNFEDMIYILHFIYDVNLSRERNPGGRFIHEVPKRELLLKKTRKVLADGIRKFIAYAVELKEKQPQMFHELMEDYDLCSQICSLSSGETLE